MSYNAYLLGAPSSRREWGLMPLYLVSFGDSRVRCSRTRSLPCFGLTGPHSESLAGSLPSDPRRPPAAWRARPPPDGRRRVAVAVVVMAGLTPWLFEVGRAASEFVLEPLLLSAAARCRGGVAEGCWTWLRGAAVGFEPDGDRLRLCGGAVARAAVCACTTRLRRLRARWRWFAAAWGTFVSDGRRSDRRLLVRHPRCPQRALRPDLVHHELDGALDDRRPRVSKLRSRRRSLALDRRRGSEAVCPYLWLRLDLRQPLCCSHWEASSLLQFTVDAEVLVV